MSLAWLTAIFDRVFAAIRAKSAANAGADLPAGKEAVAAIYADVGAIKGELAEPPKPAPNTPAPPSAPIR